MKHPRLNENGQPVSIRHPSTPSPLAAWSDPTAIALATPDCTMPVDIGDVAVHRWRDAPAADAEWEAITVAAFSEPPMPNVADKKPAAGVVAVEPDGRVWLVAPTNGFGGYEATFPKGKAEGMSLHATANKEAFEESGLKVALLDYLSDSVRTTSVTRYYVARRIGGSPAAMGWESQAVMLVPARDLARIACHPNDRPVVQAILARINRGK